MLNSAVRRKTRKREGCTKGLDETLVARAHVEHGGDIADGKRALDERVSSHSFCDPFGMQASNVNSNCAATRKTWEEEKTRRRT